MTEITMGELRKLTIELPDEAPVLYRDHNFGGRYWIAPEHRDFEVADN